MWSPGFEDHKEIVPELMTCTNRKTNGRPMKMLIAQEMSQQVDVKLNTPNVVAKLMGLDAQPHSVAIRGRSRRSLSHSGIPFECWQREGDFSIKRVQCEVDQRLEQNDYKDVHEIRNPSQQTKYLRDRSPQRGRSNEDTSDKMALVREKFMEAKRMATDEKLCQSKEFQEVLDFLSSMKDIFPKYLQEQNSLFSQHLYEVPSVHPPPETKQRITVLRPSKLAESEKFSGLGKKSDNQIQKSALVGQATGWVTNNPAYPPSFPSQHGDEYPAQPTRIVVLKPSPGKTHDTKEMVSQPPSSPKILHAEDFFDEAEYNKGRESRKAAKKITRQMRKNLMGHRRDEALISSVFSNGYIGDESSFNKSETESAVGNLSDSEVMSPTSRHSWDYINRFGSPYSSSSFSRASCSPESSVCREAKKRLSERWALVASNGGSQEQRRVRRGSSTLGEMLALSDTVKLQRSEEESRGMNQEPRGLTASSSNNLRPGIGDSPENLPRSRSVPVSSTVYDNLSMKVSDTELSNTPVSMELMEAKSMKSSFKWKVPSFFSSKSKKSKKGKSSASHTEDNSQTPTAVKPGSPGYPPSKSDNASPCIGDKGLEECLSHGLHESSHKSSPNITGMDQRRGIHSWEAGLSVAKNTVPRHGITTNQDQPSPISVLEPSFEEDYITTVKSSNNTKQGYQGLQGLLHPIKSNLIDKSPPIGSIARTLSWNYSFAEIASSHPLNPLVVLPGVGKDQDWIPLVETLLSVAGLDGTVKSDSLSARWHSPESPLDPQLRDKYAIINDEPMQEAERRQRRSTRKLVFDCVNEALMQIRGSGSDSSSVKNKPCSGAQERHIEDSSPISKDHIWARMKEWFDSEAKRISEDGGDMNSLVLERVLGKWWFEHMRLEVDDVGKEIGGKMLEDLVEEAVSDFTVGWVS